MTEIPFTDMEQLYKVTRSALSLVPAVTFVYLFIITRTSHLFWLSVISLAILGFYMAFWEKNEVLARHLSRFSEAKSFEELGTELGSLFWTDKVVWVVVGISTAWTVFALVYLVFNLIDAFTWVLLFACLLAIFRYGSMPFVYYFIGKKREEYFKKVKRATEK